MKTATLFALIQRVVAMVVLIMSCLDKDGTTTTAVLDTSSLSKKPLRSLRDSSLSLKGGNCTRDTDCPLPPCTPNPMDGLSTSCPISICSRTIKKCQTIQTFTKCGKSKMCSSDEYCCSESCGLCINKALKIKCREPVC
jgi:hypothetical protein